MAEPLAREEIVWSGQPVALVIAESDAAAEDGAALVWVEEEPLPAVLDLEAAMADDAEPARVTEVAGGGDGGAGAHGAGGGEDEAAEELPPNVAVRQRMTNGDVEAALARADAVVSGRFRTNWIHQAYIEPQSCLAWTDPDGTLVVHSSTQGAFMARQGLSEMLGLPVDRVRVQAAPLGGAFGGKLMISEPLAAAAALKLGRPVRLVFRRSEDFAAANPAPGQLIDLELGATRSGELTAIRGRIVGDRGGLGEMGVETISALLSAGPYRWSAHDLTAVGVSTNRVSAGAYRAPGAPPAAFAVESLMDRVAAELGPGPDRLPAAERADRRRRRPRRAGDQGLRRARVPRARAGAPALAGPGELPDDEGVGVALGFWPGGLEPAAAICKLDSDGKLTVVTAAADMSGIENAFIAIAADTFGLAEDSVRVVTGGHVQLALRRRLGRFEGHLHVREGDRAGRGRRARAPARRRRLRAGDRTRGPRASRRRGPPARLAGPRHRGGRAGGQDVHVRQPARADRGLRGQSRRSAARPAPRRTSRTCGWTARPAA